MKRGRDLDSETPTILERLGSARIGHRASSTLMPYYKTISRAEFANLRWKRYESYQFASQDAVAPPVVQGLAKACMTLPIAFIEKDQTFLPAAIMGLRQGQNLFVGTDGRWMGSYIPAAYRSHPFAFAKSDDSQFVLWVDTESGLVGEAHPETFFDTDGKPSPAIKNVPDLLQKVSLNGETTAQVCAAIHREGLIQQWPITLKEGQNDQIVNDLFRITKRRSTVWMRKRCIALSKLMPYR